MAIQDDNNGANQTTMGAAFQRATPQAPAAASNTGGGAQQPPRGPAAAPASSGGARPGSFSFRNMGSLVNTPMGRTPASEVLQKLEKALKTVYENANSKFEIDVIPLDMGQNPVLSVSCLVVAMRLKADRDTGVGYHTLILGGSTEPPANKYVPINGQQIEVLVTMGEANNDRLREFVADTVAAAYPQQRIWTADAEVVPSDFNVADETAVYLLAANAAYACSVELDQKRAGFVDMNLANADKSDQLTCRVGFPKNQVLNAVSHPNRQDMTADLQAGPANQQNQQNQQQVMERSATVARVSGFFDLVWAPAIPQSNQFNPFGPQQQPMGQQPPNFFQKYIPRLVMTNMESVAAPTLSCQLLALVLAASVAENNMWVQAFRPAPYAGGIDMHDIGAIGIEVNFDGNQNGVGTRINTKDDGFKPGDLNRLIAATMKPALIFSLDVEECGPGTWVNGVFAYAASGHAGAQRAIIAAADQLTNGAFSRYFPQNSRVCINEDNRIHLGYYFDGDVKKDIRDIDYLAVLNLIGERDPEVVRDWSDTFQQTQFPLEQRLAARKRIITAAAPTAVFTGFAHRVTFEAAFMDALIRGCADCNLDIKSVAPYQDAAAYDRATATFASHTMFQQQPGATVFNRGGAAYGASQASQGVRQFGGGTAGGRWY